MAAARTAGRRPARRTGAARRVEGREPDRRRRPRGGCAAYDAFRESAARHLEVVGFADLYQVNVGIDGRAEVGSAHAVSGNYFDVLGVAPALGRALGSADDRDDAAAAAVISDGLWLRR